MGGGFVKAVRVGGHRCEIFVADGEGYVGFCDDLSNVEVYGDSIQDVLSELSVAVEVENELDAMWNSEGVLDDEEEIEQ